MGTTMKFPHKKAERIFGLPLMVVLFAIITFFALSSANTYLPHAAFLSHEMAFTDNSTHGLRIVPASCPSDPHAEGNCSCTITLTPSSFSQGESAALSWAVSPNAQNIVLLSNSGSASLPTLEANLAPSGQLSVSPDVTTTYTVTGEVTSVGENQNVLSGWPAAAGEVAQFFNSEGGWSSQDVSGVRSNTETFECSAVATVSANASDKCTNVPGVQMAVPTNAVALQNGTCVCRAPLDFDWVSWSCIDASLDQCVNIPHVQQQVPQNATRTSGSCACNVGYHFDGQFRCMKDLIYDNGGVTAGGSCPAECQFGCYGLRCLAAPAPKLTLAVKPSLVRPGDTTQVVWTSVSTQSCSVFGTNGDGGSQAPLWNALSGNITSSPIKSQVTYSIRCTGLDGSTISDSVTVAILPAFREL